MQYTRTQAQNEQLPVQHFDKIRHHCPIIAKSFLAFPHDFCHKASRYGTCVSCAAEVVEKIVL